MSLTRTTHSPSREAARAARRWFVADADGEVLGRLASRIAAVLRGKLNPRFAPHLDAGDFVVVVNAAKIRLTGAKLRRKEYIRHTGYPGGVRRVRAEEVLAKHPTRLVREAVEGMLPKNRLGRRLVTKLKVYPGPDHPHRAQKPVPLPSARSRPVERSGSAE
jgi:large subunit ribosomal protein L13